ncbi:NB-ARC domain, LRR domain containing protein [Trema orientale]|uniref:NB-ARC domain, LRR domain containing protein n=1 Tax=Trema orientale TaxID=63057 RepID=A0A2P5DAK7_TREOI|nr:NB-ARC domain, LRR domain containing protein [Trema orientale]
MEIASLVAESVVKSSIDSLVKGIKDEVEFLSAVGNEVENSKPWLDAFHRFLRDADKYSRYADNRLCWWVSQIREVVCDLEAAIETYDVQVAPRTWIRKNLLKLHKVGSEIEEIRLRVSALPQILQGIGVNNRDIASPLNVGRAVRRRTFGHPRDADVVGFEKNIEDLVARLTKENSEQVVAICGMGGLGKTTLAREVYSHCKDGNYFDCFGWVYVSQDYQVRKIYEDLLIDLVCADKGTAEEIRGMTDNQLVERLCNIQRGKNCLVILDDVWKIELWEHLSCVLPKDNANSKILLTTRYRKVAAQVNRRDVFIHELRCLDESDSWKLLEKRATFRSIYNPADLGDHKKKLEELREELIGHCAGLPLAINILGGLLSSEIRARDDWEILRRNIKKRINKAEIGGHDQVNSVSMVLSLSYDALPYHLKRCFLFLAHSHKKFKIKVNELCRMWIAEGFMISSMENQEVAAHACFGELVDRYMVQITEFGSTGRAKACGLHDLIREFCLLGAQEENFLRVVDSRNKTEEVDTVSFGTTSTRPQMPSSKVRRLSIHLNSNINEELGPIIKSGDRSVRSFTCFSQISHPFYEAGTLKKLFKRFYLLRTLKFENSSRSRVELPKEIGMLVHLRFLSLKGSHVEKLPSSIGKLRLLQSLDLRTNWSIKLTNAVGELNELRHLYLPYISDESKEILQLDNLNSLRTLVNISTKFCKLKSSDKLTGLEKLKIYIDEEFQEFLPENIRFEQLQSLAVMLSGVFGHAIDITPLVSACPAILKLRVELPITNLPQLSRSLIKLTLRHTGLDCDPMSTLKELPNLKILVLGSNVFEGTEMACSKGGFSRLESLSLIDLVHLNKWKVGEEAFPTLFHLHVESCHELREISDALRHITSLNKMIIKGMPWEFRRRIKRGGEDFDKIELVSIEFRPVY